MSKDNNGFNGLMSRAGAVVLLLLSSNIANAGTIDDASFCVTSTDFQFSIDITSVNAATIDLSLNVYIQGGLGENTPTEYFDVNLDRDTCQVSRSNFPEVEEFNGTPAEDRLQNGTFSSYTLTDLGDAQCRFSGSIPHGVNPFVAGDTVSQVFYREFDPTINDFANDVTITDCPAAVTYSVAATVAGANGTVSCSPENVTAGGSSTCTAVPAAGYRVSAWTGACAAAGTSDTCTLDNIQADQSSTVSFDAIPGSITVTKIATPATLPDGNLPAFLFSGDAAGGVVAGSSLVVDNLAPGSYTSTEEDPGNYELVDISCNDAGSTTPSSGDIATATATFNLDPGENVECVFTNLRFATLNVIKHVVNDDGGTATLTDFGISTDAGVIGWDAPVVNGDVTTYTGFVLDISSSQTPFTLSEVDVDGYTEGNWVCDGSDAGTFDAGSVVLGPGDEVTCEITNDDDAATPPPVETVPVPVDNRWLLGVLALLMLAAGVVGIRRIG